MSDWETVGFGDLGTIYDGPHATPDRVTEGPYFLNIASLDNGRLDLSKSDHVTHDDFARWTRRVTPREGDLLFSYETRLGDAALMPPGISACLGRRMALLRPDTSRVDPRFLLYLYLGPAMQRTIEQNTIHGATVNRIALSTIGRWPVKIPHLDEQRAIAEVLGALDDKIAVNNSSEHTIDHVISAHYQRALGERDTTTRALLDEFDVEFGEPFSGALFTTPGTGRPLIRIRDLGTFKPQIWTSESRPRETVVRPGDLLVGMDAEFRATIWLGSAGLLNQRVCRVRSHRGGSAYVREALRSPLAEIENYKSATTVIHLNKADLARSTFVMPEAESLARFEIIAEPLLGLRVSLAQERASLAATRDALLPPLMSGKLRVRDAERIVEEVV